MTIVTQALLEDTFSNAKSSVICQAEGTRPGNRFVRLEKLPQAHTCNLGKQKVSTPFI